MTFDISHVGNKIPPIKIGIIFGIIFILCKTVSLEVFCKAAVMTVIALVEINFGRKKA
jgi:hypothetical protein